MKKMILAIAVIAIGAVSCYKDNAQDMYPSGGTCDTSNVTFSGVVLPIIQAKCTNGSCHGAGASINLTTYAGLEEVAMHGTLLPAINHTGSKPMPDGQPKLDDCTIAKITKWVNAGAPNN
jgi:hypothetical protein